MRGLASSGVSAGSAVPLLMNAIKAKERNTKHPVILKLFVLYTEKINEKI